MEYSANHMNVTNKQIKANMFVCFPPMQILLHLYSYIISEHRLQIISIHKVRYKYASAPVAVC